MVIDNKRDERLKKMKGSKSIMMGHVNRKEKITMRSINEIR
jgi:anionic cell wall polymer biosynthesis LytR-Cps2A-Psr (LCP) family protein